jgi:hypothetical protein
MSWVEANINITRVFIVNDTPAFLEPALPEKK